MITMKDVCADEITERMGLCELRDWLQIDESDIVSFLIDKYEREYNNMEKFIDLPLAKCLHYIGITEEECCNMLKIAYADDLQYAIEETYPDTECDE